MDLEIRNERQLKGLTGVNQTQLNQIERTFAQVYQEDKQRAYEIAVAAGERERAPGGGRKPKLLTNHAKVIFVLYYLKNYPTFDVLGSHFGLAASKAHDNLKALLPILYESLVRLGVMPQREFHSVEQFRQACADLAEIIIDVTERPHHRPGDNEDQRDFYSGKKRRHTVKNTVISSIKKVILFLGHTFSGRQHDYAMLKEEFPPEEAWFACLKVLVDLGYQGIQSDYEGEQIEIPHKKPRKSKRHPDPQLTDDQKAENRAISQTRIFVEHAIGGMKHFRILTTPFRNHQTGLVDDVIALTAALWNLALSS